MENPNCLLDRELLIRIDERQKTTLEKLESIEDHYMSHAKDIEDIEYCITKQDLKLAELSLLLKEKEDFISKKSISWYVILFGTTFGIISAIVNIIERFKHSSGG